MDALEPVELTPLSRTNTGVKRELQCPLRLAYDENISSSANSEQILPLLDSIICPHPDCQRPQNFYLCHLSLDSENGLVQSSFKSICRSCKSSHISPLPCTASSIEPPEISMPRFTTTETKIDTKVSIFFLGIESHLMHLYKPGQPMVPRGDYYSICKPAWEWLIRTVDPFPAFMDAIRSRGYLGSFTTTEALHIMIQNPWHRPRTGLLYFKLALASDQVSAIIIDNDIEQLRSGLTKFIDMDHTKANGFSMIHYILRFYSVKLNASRNALVSRILDSEVDTGKGSVTEGIRLLKTDTGGVTPSSEDHYHSDANRTLSATISADYMISLTNFIIQTREKYMRLRTGSNLGQNLDQHPGTFEEELLQAQHSIFKFQQQNLTYWHKRAERQASVIGNMISRDIAEESRRSGSFMMIMAMFQVIFLPFTFVAQFFATGFFIFPERKVSVLTIDPQIKYMIIFGLSFTILSILLLGYAGYVVSTKKLSSWKRVSGQSEKKTFGDQPTRG